MNDPVEEIISTISKDEVASLSVEELARKVLFVGCKFPENLPVIEPENMGSRRLWTINTIGDEALTLIIDELCDKVGPHLAQIAWHDISDFFEALRNGKSHPLLNDWKQRSDNRPVGGQRLLELKRIAVFGVTTLKAYGLPFRYGQKEVAKIANKSGVFSEHLDKRKQVTAKSIEHWRSDYPLTEPNPIKGRKKFSKAFRLEKIYAGDYKNSRTFKFWAEHTRHSFLALGLPWIDQMLLSEIDPFENYPEEYRRAVYVQGKQNSL